MGSDKLTIIPYISYDERLESFNHRCWKIQTQNVEELARSGFFYTKYKDTIMCYSCKLIMENFTNHIDPIYYHIYYEEDCEHLHRYIGENVFYEKKKISELLYRYNKKHFVDISYGRKKRIIYEVYKDEKKKIRETIILPKKIIKEENEFYIYHDGRYYSFPKLNVPYDNKDILCAIECGFHYKCQDIAKCVACDFELKIVKFSENNKYKKYYFNINHKCYLSRELKKYEISRVHDDQYKVKIGDDSIHNPIYRHILAFDKLDDSRSLKIMLKNFCISFNERNNNIYNNRDILLAITYLIGVNKPFVITVGYDYYFRVDKKLLIETIEYVNGVDDSRLD